MSAKQRIFWSMETLVPDAELFHQETKVVAFGNLLAQGLSPPQGPLR